MICVYDPIFIVIVNVYHVLIRACSIINLFKKLSPLFKMIIVHQVSKVKVGVHQRNKLLVTQPRYLWTVILPSHQKKSTNLPSTRENACSFNFTILCSKFDQMWYFRYQSGNCKWNDNNKWHIPVHRAHISQSIKYLPHDVNTFIQAYFRITYLQA